MSEYLAIHLHPLPDNFQADNNVTFENRNPDAPFIEAHSVLLQKAWKWLELFGLMFCTTDWIWTAANWLFLLGVGVFVFCPFDISLIFFLWYICFSFFGQSGTFLREANFMFWAVWGILNINLIPLEDEALAQGLSLPVSLPGQCPMNSKLWLQQQQ